MPYLLYEQIPTQAVCGGPVIPYSWCTPGHAAALWPLCEQESPQDHWQDPSPGILTKQFLNPHLQSSAKASKVKVHIES